MMETETPDTDDAFLSQRLWLGLKRWTWVKIAFGGLVLWLTLILWQEQEFELREDREEAQEQLDNDYTSCLRGNDVRQVITDLILLVAENPTDFTRVEGFDELDPAMQAYLINFTTAQDTRENTEAYTQGTLELLAQRDCEKEYPHATDVRGE